MKKFLDYVDGKPGAEKGDPYIRRLHQDVENVRMNKEWRREYMDFQITIKQKEREAVEKAAPKIREEAIAEATPKIRAEAIAEATPKIIAGEKNRIITRMLEDGSLSDEQIVAITGASAEELENCKRAVRKN